MAEIGLAYDPGLKRDILAVLSRAVGKENAIPRGRLVQMVGRWDQDGDFDRLVRKAIVDLRMEGHLICSTGGPGGGYWLARDWPELTDFVNREYHSRAMSMLETEKIMKEAAQDKWGPKQPRLF